MAFQLKLLLPCLCTTLVLLSIFSFSHAKKRPCTCPDLDQDQRSNRTMDDSELILVDQDTGLITIGGNNLSDYAESNTTGRIPFWQTRPDGLGVDESSFSVHFIYRRMQGESGSISFLILPSKAMEFLQERDYLPTVKPLLDKVRDGSLELSNSTLYNSNAGNLSSVNITIGTLLLVRNPVLVIDFSIDKSTAGGSSYSMWIDYHRAILWVYLVAFEVEDNNPKPANAIAVAPLNISDVFSQYVYFGVVATAEQLHTRGINFSATVENLPTYHPDQRGFLSKKVTILSAGLGSLAATAVVALAGAWYITSSYRRRWRKDLDQLAKSIECLPGVPTKVDFDDITKATGNFHETMKLGGGGFGTVYRCTLSAAASKTDRPMDVAVKRFTRDLQNHRYDDFLAEVSIINRLRHKNIVPLVGWAYNKGVPLLVFEYMKNGSLDQHLFSGGDNAGAATILQWATRYEIIRGISTGLHYVHHEYEPMVLHRDIKASNVMLDSSFRARLGDFGLACTVAVDRNSVTGTLGGTWGYIAPEYAMCLKTTRQTDIYALGVLILEVVTGQRALARHLAGDDNDHITDRVWRLHREGKLLECVDAMLITASSPEDQEQANVRGEAERLLLLGLACTAPNPSDRPTMPDVVQVIAKSAPPPKVPPGKPTFMWPPPEQWASDDDIDTSTGTLTMSNILDRSRD